MLSGRGLLPYTPWNQANGERGQITLPYEPEAGLVEELVAQRVKPAEGGLSS